MVDTARRNPDLLRRDMQTGFGVQPPSGGADRPEGGDKVRVAERLAAPEGHAAARCQIVKIVLPDKSAQFVRRHPTDAGFVRRTHSLRIEAHPALQGAPLRPDQCRHTCAVGRHAQAADERQRKSSLLQSLPGASHLIYRLSRQGILHPASPPATAPLSAAL